MPNFAAEVKKQTDKILRQQKLNGTGSTSISGTGGGTSGTDPVVIDAYAALQRHKTSGDHDDRYYTEAEVDAMIAAQIAGFAEVVRQDFENTDSIEVNHNLGRRPMVQVQGSAIGDYGAGLYGADTYGGISPYTVLSPTEIEHSLDSNTITIALDDDYTGEVICVG